MKHHHHTKIQVVVDKDSPSSIEQAAKEEKHCSGESKAPYVAQDPELVAEQLELKKDWTKLKIALVTGTTALVGAGVGVSIAWLSGKCK